MPVHHNTCRFSTVGKFSRFVRIIIHNVRAATSTPKRIARNNNKVRDKGSSLLLYSAVIALYHGHCPYSGLQIMQISLYHSCACWLLCLSRSATLRRRAGYRIPSHIKPCYALYQNYAPSGEHRRAVAHNLICTRNAPVAGHKERSRLPPRKFLVM